MLLAGSFSEYSLSLVLEKLRHSKETGLLEVSSPKQSGYFFIKNGEIKDGEVGKLRGAAAIELAGSFVDASFEFKRLEPTDYARVVWEKSFDPNRLVAVTPNIRVEACRTMLKQFLSYAEAAYGNKEIILKYASALSFQAFALIRKRAAMLPSLQEVANRIISSRVLMVALLGGTALTISQILRRQPEHVDTTVASTVENVETVATTDEKIGTQSLAQPRHVSRERAKRELRNGRQTPTEQKRDASLAQEPRFLPQVAAAQAPRNAASVSEVPEKQPATTSGVQAIPVVLQIENGHISQASVLKHRAGMARYEAAALRIARQRRYPTAGKHTEIVVVKVTQPNPN